MGKYILKTINEVIEHGRYIGNLSQLSFSDANSKILNDEWLVVTIKFKNDEYDYSFELIYVPKESDWNCFKNDMHTYKEYPNVYAVNKTYDIINNN